MKFLVLNLPRPEKNPERQIVDTQHVIGEVQSGFLPKVKSVWSSSPGPAGSRAWFFCLGGVTLQKIFHWHIKTNKKPPFNKNESENKENLEIEHHSTVILSDLLYNLKPTAFLLFHHTDISMDKTEFQAGCFISWERSPESERLRCKWLPLHVSSFPNGSFIDHPYDICATVGRACSCPHSENKGAKRT